MRCSLLALLSVAVLATGCHRSTDTGVSIDSSFRSFIPPETKALVGVRIDQLKTSDFFKRHQAEMNLSQTGVLSERIGLDPARDLSDLVLAWDGKQVLVLARGRFQADTVKQKLSQMAPKQEIYRSFTLYGDKGESLALLPKNVALAGPSAGIKQAIDDSASGGGGVPIDLQLRLHGVLSNAQIWGASQGVLPLANLPMRSDIQSGLANLSDYINGATFGIALDAGAHLEIDVSCISAEGSQRVNDALKGLIGFARLSTRDDELDMLRLWDSLKVDKTDRGVRIHDDLPADLADKFLSQMLKMSGRAR